MNYIERLTIFAELLCTISPKSMKTPLGFVLYDGVVYATPSPVIDLTNEDLIYLGSCVCDESDNAVFERADNTIMSRQLFNDFLNKCTEHNCYYYAPPKRPPTLDKAIEAILCSYGYRRID